MQTMTEKLGIYVALVTPYAKDGTLNPAAQVKLMERNLREGASGFFLGGSSAECWLLSHQERVEIFKTAVPFLSRTHLIAHVGANSTWEAIRFAQEAKALGYTMIAATPPQYYGYSPKEIASYYYDIYQATGLPVMVYNFPGNTHRDFNLEDPVYQKLFSSDAIWGIKHTNQVVYQLEQFMRLNPRLKLFNGYDETMIATMAYGCTGSIGSTVNCLLPHVEKIYHACDEGRIEEARELQHKANAIMQAFCKVGLFPAVKYVCSTLGDDVGVPRRPFTPLTDEQKRYIDDVMDQYFVR